MAKQLNVDLRFTANNAQAKQQIQDLQTVLDKLITTSGKSSSGLGITKDIAQATSEVAKLQAMLESSKNASGGLDLGKFNQSLAQGQVKISDYAKTLSSLGPQGDQAFAKLAKAIINAEVPLKRTNGLLKEFKTSLANTARWQLSSSMLHGFMGAVQSAYGYAQDLNESLNNIRIVTGQNIEQMATFAKEANKAAQALSTTTTEYTDASLIYYQQGLSDSEVAKRTEVTIKMANAAGQSAQIVSDQLTAVWNNFYDGSKSLEYYADVMTALGAATASSTDEIAGGLEKFAAIGETIGLSYEYAASALATITSNTRQSEEVVGTALKTIFARIQGLNLGETLDDGTSLNKYSAALEKVGISIFEQNGEIKKMDNILDEMAAKWGTLAKDQQIALAQTVAGVRQYTQLIALMDNWDAGDSDSMVANLDTAYNATGALQKQADIYAESWEAARDRVTAAAEEIYNQLLNDEFFIDLNNGFAGFLNIVSNTIDALGGLPGVLTVASSIMFRMFGKDMAKAIDDWGYNIKLRSSEGVQEILKLRQESIEALRNVYADNVDTGSVNATSQASFESQAVIADTLLVKRQQLLANGQALSEQDERQAQLLLKINEAYGEQAIESAKSLENAQKQSDLLESQARTQMRRYNNAQTDPSNKINLTAELNQIKQAQIQYSTLEATFNKLSRAKSNFNSGDEMIQALKTMSETATAAGMDMTAFEQVLAKLSTGMSVDEVLNAIETEMNQIGDAAYNNIEKVNGLREKLQQIGMSDEQINKLIASWERQGIITSEVAENLRNVKVQGDEAAAAINKMQGPPPTVGQKFMAVANTISNIAMSINAVKGLIDTWNNDDMSFGEKLLSTFTTLGMVIPMVTTALSGNNLALLGSASSSIVAAAGFKGVDIAAKMAAGGVGALWAALWPIALVAAAVAAAIAILVVSIKAISNAYNADAIAAEQAEKAASNLADAYNEAKQEYQDMIAAMDNYKSARDALDNLTEGTKEYEAALKEANRAALELINKYGLIEGQDYNWEGDQLAIKDDAMDRVSSAKEAEMDQAYAASQMAGASAKAVRSKADLTETRRDIRDANGLGDGDRAWQGVVNSITAAIGIALAPVTGGLSLVTTALAAGTSLNSDIKAAEMDVAIAKAVEAAREDQNLFDTKEAMAKALNIDINDTKLVDALWANQEEIKSLAQEMNAAEAAWKLAAQNSANEILNNNEIVQNSENADEVMAAGGKMYGTAYDAAYKTYLEDAKSRGWFNTGNTDSKAAFEEYAKEAGLDQLKNFKVTNYKGDGTVEYKYIDENGTEQKKVATAEEIAATLAAAKAAEQLGASAENLVRVFNSLDASGQAFDQAMKNFLSTGDFENSTRGEATELIKQVDSGGDGVADNVEVTTYLGGRFGGNDKILSDEEAKQYGYESAQAMIDSFTKELANIDKAWDSIQLPDNIVGLDNMSLKTAQAIENSFNEINLGPAGAKAGADYVNGINKMIAGLSEEDQTEALTQLATIDWSSWDAMDQAKQIMKEFGVEIDLTSAEWQKFASDMRIAAGAIPDFSRLKSDLNEITGILQDLDFGDIISDEDYQRLVEYNNEWERFFILQADGSRKFIGNAAQMQEITRENIRQQRQELAERRQIQKDFANVGWGHTDANGNQIAADWGSKTGKDTSTAQNLLNASDATEAALNILGYSDQVIQEILNKANSSNAEIAAQGEAQLQEMYQRIAEFQKEELDAMDAEFAEMIASTATNMDELNSMMNTEEITVEAWERQAAYLESLAAKNATTLAELDAVVNDFNLKELDESYTQNLMRIAEGYESCAEELVNYQAALTAFTLDDSNTELKEQLALAEDNLRAMIRLEEGAKQYGLEVEVLTAQSKRMAEAYGLSAEEAANLAIQNQRMNKGVSALVDNWKDWKKQLSASNKLTEDYAEAIVDCTAAIADLVGASEDLELPDEFFNAENMALIEKAIKGDVNAINKLGAAVAYATVEALEFNEAFATLIGEMETFRDEPIDLSLINEEKFLEDQQLVLQGIEDIKNGVIAAGGAMDAEWVAALNRMALTTGMSVEQMNGLLGSLGVQAKVETTYVKQPMEVPTFIEHVVPQAPVTVQQGNNADGSPNMVTYTPVQKYSVPGPPMKVEGYAAVAQISTVDNPLTPQITTSGGPAATYSGNRGPVTPSATKGSNKGGGGGSKKQTKETKTAKDEIDRYHTVKEQLEELSKQLDKVSKAKDRAFGKAKLDLINQEIELLDKEIEKQELYLSQIESNARTDKALMVVYGAEFDENGVITNYEALMQQELEKYNSAVIAYNNDGDEAAFAAAEARYEKFKEDLAQYEETMDLWFDEEEKRAELLREQYDKQLEALTYKVELEISLEDDELKMIEYYLELIEDDSFAAAEAIALLGEKTQNTLDKIKIYSEGISELLDLHGMDQDDLDQIMAGNMTNEELAEKGFTENDISTLRSYIDELMNANLELKELRDTMQEKVLDVFDAFMEKLDQSVEKIEYLNNVIESYKNIIDLVGTKTLGLNDEFMKNLSQAAISTATDLIESNRIKYESALEAQKKAQAEYEAAVTRGDEESIKMWEETLQEIDSEVQESHENMLSSWESALQMAADAFDQAVERTIANFEKAISGTYGSLESLMTAFDRHSEINERYVEDYKKIYELSKLNRDITNSIDETDSIKAKQELKKLQEEINKLQESDTQMSQYDLDYLQKKYDLKLAEIALEDAQNAKTQVRLRRDTEGNFSYVYTGDQATIDNAQQNYEDKLYEMQEFNDEYLKTVQENILNSEIELADALAELDRSKFATDEEYYAEVNRITEYYVEQHKFWIDEANKALKNNKNTYEEDWNNYSKITGYKISKNEDYVDSFDETIYAQLTGYESLEEAQFSFVEATNIMIEELDAAFEEWLSNYDAIMLAAGTSSENFANDTTQAFETIKEESSEAVEQASEDADDISDAFGEICDAVSAWQEEYSDAIGSAMDSNENMIDSCTSLISQLSNVNGSLANTGRNFTNTASEIAAAAANIEAAAARAAAAASNIGSTGGFSGGGSYSSGTGSKYKATYKVGGKSNTISGYNSEQAARSAAENKIIAYINSLGAMTVSERRSMQQNANSTIRVSSYDTGGYTGAWGPYGKLALLHEKELILNKDDTENFLTGIKILRNIMSTLDLQTNYNLSNSMMTAPTFNSSNNDTLEQIVQIQAEFPNVTNRSEIEEAFDTLINSASQYANRKK